jgi:hypothetical protein
MKSDHCNITFFNGIVLNSESPLLYNYVNYHFFMFISFWFLAMICTVRGMLHWILCNSNSENESVERSFYLGCLFLIFAIGFEEILLVIICVFCMAKKWCCFFERRNSSFFCMLPMTGIQIHWMDGEISESEQADNRNNIAASNLNTESNENEGF